MITSFMSFYRTLQGQRGRNAPGLINACSDGVTEALDAVYGVGQ